MAVNTVFCNVELTALKPFYIRLFKIPFKRLIPLLSPVKTSGYFTPKCFRLFYTFLIGLLVFF